MKWCWEGILGKSKVGINDAQLPICPPHARTREPQLSLAYPTNPVNDKVVPVCGGVIFRAFTHTPDTTQKMVGFLFQYTWWRGHGPYMINNQLQYILINFSTYLFICHASQLHNLRDWWLNKKQCLFVRDMACKLPGMSLFCVGCSC